MLYAVIKKTGWKNAVRWLQQKLVPLLTTLELTVDLSTTFYTFSFKISLPMENINGIFTSRAQMMRSINIYSIYIYLFYYNVHLTVHYCFLSSYYDRGGASLAMLSTPMRVTANVQSRVQTPMNSGSLYREEQQAGVWCASESGGCHLGGGLSPPCWSFVPLDWLWL